MTGICIDVFKDTLYVFADGMISDTESGLIYSTTTDKIIKLSDKCIITYCGDCHLVEPCIALLKQNKLIPKYLKSLKGDGEVIVISKTEVVEIFFDIDEETDKCSVRMMRSLLTASPFFFGVGDACLSSAYAALKPNKCRVEKSYLNRMKKVFKASCERISSMGELNQIETLNLNKDKVK